MGIDAQLLLRVRSSVTEDDLRHWSWQLAETIGADKLYWLHEGKNGAEKPCIWFAPRYQLDDDNPLPLGSIYYQDGEDIVAQPGEILLEIDPLTRYYGPGYERGDILHICAIAEWCELNIPNCEVWYGGDSSGVEATLFDAAARLEMKKHLYSKNGRDYFRGRMDGLFPHEAACRPDVSSCKLCPTKSNAMLSRYGFGQNFAAYHCAGCGQNFITRDNGQTWEHKDNL